MARAYYDNLDFTLHLSRLDHDLKDNHATHTTNVKHIGISSFDTSDATLQPGILIGYAYTSSDQPQMAELDPQGYFLGPILRWQLLYMPQFSAALAGSYLFQRIKDDTPAQSATLEWYQPQLDLDATWRLSSRIGITAGAQYGRIDVDAKLAGTVNRKLTLRQDAALGGRAGLKFFFGDDGQAGIVMHRDLGDGVEIYFQRQF